MATATKNQTEIFIITKDEGGNDRVFAGCENFEATWTLQAEKMRSFKSFDLALTIAKQFDGWRLHNADPVLGPKIVHADNKFFVV